MYAALIQGQESRLNNSLAIFDTVNGYITDTVLKRVSDFRARWILAISTGMRMQWAGSSSLPVRLKGMIDNVVSTLEYQ